MVSPWPELPPKNTNTPEDMEVLVCVYEAVLPMHMLSLAPDSSRMVE